MVTPDRENFKRQVQETTDIVQLIGEHIALRPKGREFACICPFHDDTKPSMFVSPAKQIYKCFACGAGGDVFSFVMNYLNMSFPEAIEYLAERANLQPPPSSYRGDGQSQDGPSPRQRIIEANKLAVAWFRKMLNDPKSGHIAREYIQQRGISDEMNEAFQLGYAPDAWEALSEEITRRRWDREAFELAGLIASRDHGPGYFDRLRHRLIIPIFDGSGRPIAFGGRILAGSTREDKSDAKYLNSPETRVFNKSETLFGLHLAQRSIIKSRTAIIVEGYTDVIACHQHGVTNAVATLGTALTADHARKLRNYCDRVILVFDADEAGQRAADRALQVFFHEPIDVSIAVLPDGLDPADLLGEEDGKLRWERATREEAADAMSFHFSRFRAAFEREQTLAGKQRIAEDYLRNLTDLGLQRLDPVRRGLILPRIADLLRIDSETLRTMMSRIADRARPRHDLEPEYPIDDHSADPEEAATHARAKAERTIVGCLLAQPQLFHQEMPDGMPFYESLPPGCFSHPPARRVYEISHDILLDRDQISLSDLRDGTGSEALVRLAASMLFEVENRTADDDQAILSAMIDASETLHEYLRQEEYETRRLGAGLNDASTEKAEEDAMLEALKHARERRTIRRSRSPRGQ